MHCWLWSVFSHLLHPNLCFYSQVLIVDQDIPGSEDVHGLLGPARERPEPEEDQQGQARSVCDGIHSILEYTALGLGAC